MKRNDKKPCERQALTDISQTKTKSCFVLCSLQFSVASRSAARFFFFLRLVHSHTRYRLLIPCTIRSFVRLFLVAGCRHRAHTICCRLLVPQRVATQQILHQSKQVAVVWDEEKAARAHQLTNDWIIIIFWCVRCPFSAWSIAIFQQRARLFNNGRRYHCTIILVIVSLLIRVSYHMRLTYIGHHG